ncbi:hypothetical protein AVEN_210654-1, partial [Araneus ventricosus]
MSLSAANFHADIGIQCDNYLGSQKSSNWKGINFFYGKARLREPIENKVSRHYSLSILEHVNIFHAGRDTYGKAVPALEAMGQPPVINNLNLRYSAFDGINLYKPDDTFVIENSIVADNR